MTLARSLLVASAVLAALPAYGQQITAFKHIVIVVQENRTPDNLFNAMCQQHGGPAQCDPNNRQVFDILTDGWDNHLKFVTPAAVDLAIPWDIQHLHQADWVPMCDQQGSICRMDGAAGETCDGECPTNLNVPPEFTYVQRNNGTLDVLGPYIALATTYGWANHMFQTNQGPSFPAHQFIYGGTSAPSRVWGQSGNSGASL